MKFDQVQNQIDLYADDMQTFGLMVEFLKTDIVPF